MLREPEVPPPLLARLVRTRAEQRPGGLTPLACPPREPGVVVLALSRAVRARVRGSGRESRRQRRLSGTLFLPGASKSLGASRARPRAASRSDKLGAAREAAALPAPRGPLRRSLFEKAGWGAEAPSPCWSGARGGGGGLARFPRGRGEVLETGLGERLPLPLGRQTVPGSARGGGGECASKSSLASHLCS